MQPRVFQSFNTNEGAFEQDGGAKKHTCVHCYRSFKRTEHLTRHVRTHTREKPFSCRCGQSFTRRDLLRRHQKIVHAGQTSSPEASSDDARTETQRQPLNTCFDPTRAEKDSQPEPSISYLEVRSSPAQDSHVPSEEANLHQWAEVQHEPGYHAGQGADSVNGPNGVPPVTDGVMSLEQQSSQLLLPTDYQNIAPQLNYFHQGEFNHFQDFTNFLDGIGLPAEWTPLAEEQWENGDPAGEQMANDGRTSRDHQNHSHINDEEETRPDTPFRSWLPSAPPGDQSLDTINDFEPRESRAGSSPFKISEEQRTHLSNGLEPFRHIIPKFKVPSRHTLTRYLTSYMDGFHSHLPFIHIPTLRINDCLPELVLALATVGAQYRFEYRNAERIFSIAKAVVLERIRREGERQVDPVMSNLRMSYPSSYLSEQAGESVSYVAPCENSRRRTKMDIIRTLLALMGYATWEHKDMLREAFFLQGLLVQRLRDIGMRERLAEGEDSDLTWQEWAEDESDRRTKLISFSFLHMHSVAYNVYPVLRSSEIHLRLPASTKEWNALNPAQWQAAQKAAPLRQLFFQDALSRLLRQSEGTASVDPIPTPLGNYILLHGLLQRIHLVRELSLPIFDQSAALPTDELNKLERALRSWTSVWQQAPESSLDPQNENGPIPFTSSSLLGLAYVRVCLNLGPYRRLETRDPTCIAAALYKSPALERSHHLIPALLYSAHALSIPVRIGIDYVAKSQAFFWSVRHSLASLECAVLLSKWLWSLAEMKGKTTMSENESRILHWVRCIVMEAAESLDNPSDIGSNFGSDSEEDIDEPRYISNQADDHSSKRRRLESHNMDPTSQDIHLNRPATTTDVLATPSTTSNSSSHDLHSTTTLVSHQSRSDHLHTPISSETRELGLSVVKIWSRFLKRNAQWPFINVIGESLELYAKRLEEEWRRDRGPGRTG